MTSRALLASMGGCGQLEEEGLEAIVGKAPWSPFLIMPHWPPSCSDPPEGLCAGCSLCLAALPPADRFAHSRSFGPGPGHHPFRDTSAGPTPDTPHASIPFTAYMLELSHLSPLGYELCASRDHTLLITGGSWALSPGLALEKLTKLV